MLRSRELAVAAGKADDSIDLAFLAMTEHRLGNHDEAKRLLGRLEEVVAQGTADQEALSFVAEARAAVEGK